MPNFGRDTHLEMSRWVLFFYKSNRRELKIKFPLSSRVFPIAVPPLRKFEGTHGDRVAGDNTRCSHR